VSSQLTERGTRTPLNEDILADYPLLIESREYGAEEAIDWLGSEYGIPEGGIAEFGVRIQTSSTMGLVNLAFPLMNHSGAVVDLFLMLVGCPDRLKRLANGPLANRGIPAYWFGQHLSGCERAVVLVSNPLDALKLTSLGVKNVLASCCSPTKPQFISIHPEVVYFAFESSEAGKTAFRGGLNAIQRARRYVLLWSDVGVERAREIGKLSQFKSVFQLRHKMV